LLITGVALISDKEVNDIECTGVIELPPPPPPLEMYSPLGSTQAWLPPPPPKPVRRPPFLTKKVPLPVPLTPSEPPLSIIAVLLPGKDDIALEIKMGAKSEES
jgi:hypothetical protein